MQSATYYIFAIEKPFGKAICIECSLMDKVSDLGICPETLNRSSNIL